MKSERPIQLQEPNDESSGRYNVPALERGLAVLGEFDRQTQALSAPELARRLKLPRSTVFRLLMTLENLGFVERDEASHDYRLGVGVLRLGFEYLASLPLNELGRPLLERLSKASGHACNLIVRDGRWIVYVARVAPSSPFVSAVSVGTRLPAHATVLGRILLGDLSRSELRELYPETELEPFTSGTSATVDALFTLVQQDSRRGYAVSEGFFEANISTIAAPVRNDSGRIVAALGMTITSGRIEETERDLMIERVRASAAELSRLLNYAPRMQRQEKASA